MTKKKMEESDFDWDAPEEKEEEDSDSDSVFEWDNPTPPTSPNDDGHGCCQGQDQCQEDNFCHFPGPGVADFVPCICILDESSTESSVLYLGEQEIQEVITVHTSTSSEGSGQPTPPTPGTPGPEAGISQPVPLNRSNRSHHSQQMTQGNNRNSGWVMNLIYHTKLIRRIT